VSSRSSEAGMFTLLNAALKTCSYCKSETSSALDQLGTKRVLLQHAAVQMCLKLLRVACRNCMQLETRGKA